MIYEIHDLSNEKAVSLLKHGLSKVDNVNVIKNYHPDYYGSPGNLFTILDQGRYREGNGKYFVVEEDGRYICSAGWNAYDVDNSIALLLTRMYTDVMYRTNFFVGNLILPHILSETASYKKRWFTCNEYNKSIYDWFVRMYETKNMGNWPELYRNFKPIGKHPVYYVDQYVMEYINQND